MRRAQGLPVNMIVLTALALLVLVVVGAFFISGFGQASSSVTVINATQAECQNICQGMVASAFNYGSCEEFESNPQYATDGTGYADYCAPNYGACTVTVRTGVSCSCGETGCN